MRIRINWKSFFYGSLALIVAMVLPYISDMLINLVTGIRDKMPWSKKK